MLSVSHPLTSIVAPQQTLQINIKTEDSEQQLELKTHKITTKI
jgi:hypothetical protein